MLDHIIVIFLIFWGISILFSIVDAPTDNLTNSGENYLFSISTAMISLVVFLIIEILKGVRWYLIMILICISLMISEIELFFFFMCPLDLYRFSLGRCLFWLSAYFLVGFFVWFGFALFDVELYDFLLHFGYSPLSDIFFANIFSHPVGKHFVFLVISFTVKILFRFI